MLQNIEWQILNYLTLAGQPVFVSRIARDNKLGKSSVSRALKTLKNYSFIKITYQGNMTLCEVVKTASVVPHLRVTLNIIEIEPALASLKKCSDKIVLFGSCAQGVDTAESDIDLLVITRDKAKVAKVTNSIKFSRPVQWVVKTPQEYVILNNKELVFAKELGRGLVLWEGYETT
jgi:predicted nucleotidyltransferase